MYYVAGTPTDCVHLAISGVFDFEFDMVASGINDGANLGDDVLYSGTVAAAIEGRFLGLPTIALSLCTLPGGGRHFDTAARVAHRLVAGLLQRPLDAAMILNVNVPDLPYGSLAGYATTRLGFRHRSDAVIPAQNPKGQPVYWIGPAGAGADAGAGTDFQAVEDGLGYEALKGLGQDRRASTAGEARALSAEVAPLAVVTGTGHHPSAALAAVDEAGERIPPGRTVGTAVRVQEDGAQPGGLGRRHDGRPVTGRHDLAQVLPLPGDPA